MNLTQKLNLKTVDTGNMRAIETGLSILKRLKAEGKNIPKPIMLDILDRATSSETKKTYDINAGGKLGKLTICFDATNKSLKIKLNTDYANKFFAMLFSDEVKQRSNSEVGKMFLLDMVPDDNQSNELNKYLESSDHIEHALDLKIDM